MPSNPGRPKDVWSSVAMLTIWTRKKVRACYVDRRHNMLTCRPIPSATRSENNLGTSTPNGRGTGTGKVCEATRERKFRHAYTSNIVVGSKQSDYKSCSTKCNQYVSDISVDLSHELCPKMLSPSLKS